MACRSFAVGERRQREGGESMHEAVFAQSLRNRVRAMNTMWLRAIADLTPDQILQAMRRHIDPDKITVVVAGDFDKGVVPE